MLKLVIQNVIFNLYLINLTLPFIPDSPRAKISALSVVHACHQTVGFPLHDEHKEQQRTGKRRWFAQIIYEVIFPLNGRKALS